MCGIVAYINRDGVTKDKLELLISQTKHRGPDNTDYYIKGQIGLGHNRLSITDDSSFANQPLKSICGNYIISFNGEIYNYQELKKDLPEEIVFLSNSDTEVLLNLLIHYGKSILKRLNGDFAILFLNIKDNELIVARDKFGVKPLYYFNNNNEVVFASEIKSIKKIDQFDDQIDKDSIDELKTFGFTISNNTIYKKVKKIQPGSYLVFNVKKHEVVDKGIIKNNNQTLVKKSSLEENVNHLDLLINMSVQRQLKSEKKIGFMLSGGLDSSLLFAIANKKFGNIFNSYTIKNSIKEYKEAGFEDDITFAIKVSKFLNTDLSIVESKEYDLSSLCNIIEHPITDAAIFNSYNICKKAKEDNVKIIISGIGADEIFTGYRRHQISYYREFIKNLLFIKPVINLLKNTSSKMNRLSKLMNIIQGSEEKVLFKSYIRNKNNYNLTIPVNFKNLIAEATENTNLSFIEKMIYIDQKSYLSNNNLNYLDKITMSFGIEGRVPYLDSNIVDFANNLDLEFKMKNSLTKFILKKVAERYLPKEVVYRSKTGFSSPIEQMKLDETNIENQIANFKTY